MAGISIYLIQPTLGASNSVDMQLLTLVLLQNLVYTSLLILRVIMQTQKWKKTFRRLLNLSKVTHVVKNIKHLSWALSRVALAITSLVINMAITESISSIGGQPTPSVEVSKTPSYDVKESQSMTCLLTTVKIKCYTLIVT